MELLTAARLAARRVNSGGSFLFEGVDLRLTFGTRLGLVGPNGSGKSTLLRLLALAAMPDDGKVVRAPGVRTALLTQETGREVPVRAEGSTVWTAAALLAGLEPTGDSRAELDLGTAHLTRPATADSPPSDGEAHAAAATAAAELREILAALGLGRARHEEPAARLSNGERQRLALAAALAAPADVLLLDEPTNHLDLAARTWLEKHLVTRQGAVVLVSHDRALLDATTLSTAFLSTSGLRVVAASYGKAAASVAAASAQASRRRRELEKEAARLEQVAAELAAHGAKAQARRRKAVRDSATLRTRVSQLANAAGGAAAATGGVGSATFTAGARTRGNASAPRGVYTTARSDAAVPRRRAHGVLVEADHLSATGVLEDVAVRVEAGDRIALLGPNGSGKSTLLSLLAGTLAGDDPRQRLWYAPGMKLVSVDQVTRGLLPGVAVVDQGSARLGLEPARRVLAASGLPFSAWSLAPEQLSGGERARVGLALALAQPFDLLLLDEPDNDLDLAAVEGLESQLTARLADNGAALLIATHDRRLARTVADRAWSVVGGALTAHGSVLAYLRGEAGSPASLFWQGDETVRAPEPLLAQASAADRLQQLESERASLVEELSDPLSLTEREADRLGQRLSVVESLLMAAYDAALAPAAPRYRLVERGLTVYADRSAVSARPDAATTTSAHEGAAGTAPANASAEDRFVLVAEDDAASASAALRDAEPEVPWLEVKLLADVAHLRLGPTRGSCLLPRTVAALTDAGVRLAFTVLGAHSVQTFSHDDLSDTSLEPVGNGWWRVSLRRYLVLDGWHASAAGPATRKGSTELRGRRRRRKAVET